MNPTDTASLSTCFKLRFGDDGLEVLLLMIRSHIHSLYQCAPSEKGHILRVLSYYIRSIQCTDEIATVLVNLALRVKVFNPKIVTRIVKVNVNTKHLDGVCSDI